MVGGKDSRASLNLRVDTDKFAILEEMRTTGFGLATTMRNRSDVYNEVLGYGLQTLELKSSVGEKDFQRLWRIINTMNLDKLNLKQIAKLVGVEDDS